MLVRLRAFRRLRVDSTFPGFVLTRAAAPALFPALPSPRCALLPPPTRRLDSVRDAVGSSTLRHKYLDNGFPTGAFSRALWVVTYNGDANNSPSTSPCGTEFTTLGGNTPGVDP